jgi:hypothetical protein
MAKKYYTQLAGGEERPFNMAVALLVRSDLLFIKANEFSVMGDFNIWLRVLKALKRTVSFKFDDKEKKDIEKLFNTAANSIRIKDLNVEEELDTLETKIIELMYKYGLYYPRYNERKSWEDEAEGEDV